MKLTKSGKLHVSERDVERTIIAMLRADGWTCFPLRREAVKRGSGRAIELPEGCADWVAVKPQWTPAKLAELLQPLSWQTCGYTIFFELKATNARTAAKRKREQTAWREGMERRGFVCYQAPDGEADPIGHFKQWYEVVK